MRHPVSALRAPRWRTTKTLLERVAQMLTKLTKSRRTTEARVWPLVSLHSEVKNLNQLPGVDPHDLAGDASPGGRAKERYHRRDVLRLRERAEQRFCECGVAHFLR